MIFLDVLSKQPRSLFCVDAELSTWIAPTQNSFLISSWIFVSLKTYGTYLVLQEALFVFCPMCAMYWYCHYNTQYIFLLCWVYRTVTVYNVGLLSQVRSLIAHILFIFGTCCIMPHSLAVTNHSVSTKWMSKQKTDKNYLQEHSNLTGSESYPTGF